jgi:hypothetical protein
MHKKENQSTDPEFWILQTLSQGKGISPVAHIIKALMGFQGLKKFYS